MNRGIFLQKHPWKRCDDFGFPMSPVDSQFNKDISRILLTSTEESLAQVKCDSTFENACEHGASPTIQCGNVLDVSVNLNRRQLSPSVSYDEVNSRVSKNGANLTHREQRKNGIKKECEVDRSPSPADALYVVTAETDVVVAQFKNILMEAVRRRVFNLPRENLPDLSKRSFQAKSVNNERKSGHVGILFSGGIDSIVLAALADR